ncbi:MAG: hypothetical protein WCT05_08180 [Lentisphaeria bacterium]
MAKKRFFGKAVFPFVMLIFLIRILNWALGDISHDEVLSLGMYCHGLEGEVPSFWSIFRNYTLANNHMLSSACYWLWLRVISVDSSSLLLRLPSIAFGLLTLWLVSVQWRSWLGKRWSAVGGILLASSSIYTSFAYQIRGYSLSILLATLSVTALLELISSQGKRGQFLLCLSLFLQPLVMPSGVILAPAIALILLLVCIRQDKNVCAAVPIILPGLLSAGLAGAYYLTLGSQVSMAAENAGRVAVLLWTRWSALGNVLLAFGLHAGILLLPIGNLLVSPGKGTSNQRVLPEGSFSNRQLVFLLLFSILLPILGMFLLAPAKLLPFPRNCLLFLPLFTFALLLAAREQHFFRRCPVVLICLLLLYAFAVESFFSWRTGRLIQQGKRPLSLTMQLYRGANEFTRIARMCREIKLQPQTMIITQDYDLATLLWHMTACGLDTQYVHSPKTIKSEIFHRPLGNLPVLVIAQNDIQAVELMQVAGLNPRKKRLLEVFQRRRLYVVE